MTEEEYLRKQNENTIELLRQEADGSMDITKFHGFDFEKGILKPIKLLKKAHDIFAAVRLGFLPYLNEHDGADAVMLEDNKFEDVELKTCYSHISPELAFVTKLGTIYFTKDVHLWGEWVDRNKTNLAKSHFSAAFDIKKNLHTKDRKTFLICIDGNTGEYICVYSMKGESVVEFLKTSNDIKLGSFMTHGEEVKNFILPVIGWDKWLERAAKTLQVKRTTPFQQEQKRIEKERIKQEKICEQKQNLLNILGPDRYYMLYPKSHPSEQNASLCSSNNE